jgi:hypothetical protein
MRAAWCGNCMKTHKDSRRFSTERGIRSHFGGRPFRTENKNSLATNVSKALWQPKPNLNYSSGKSIKYISFSELEKETVFLLTGYPGALVGIYTGRQVMASKKVQLNSYGRANINARQLLEIARHNCGKQIYCGIMLRYDYSPRRTETIFALIDVIEIQNSVYNDKSCGDNHSLPKDLSLIIKLCSDICRQPLKQPLKLKRLPRHCQDFDEWFYTILACASVFDKTVIKVGGKLFNWKNNLKNSETKKVLQVYQEQTAGEFSFEMPDFPMLKYLPRVKRWQQAAEKLFRGKFR